MAGIHNPIINGQAMNFKKNSCNIRTKQTINNEYGACEDLNKTKRQVQGVNRIVKVTKRQVQGVNLIVKVLKKS